MKSGRTSFLALFDDDFRVEIPVIQRDYAQGRLDATSVEVRHRFLDALHDALVASGSELMPLDLDFVYGRVQDKTLQPLDGQQRLTTLFLLHWYAAGVDHRADEFRASILASDGTSRFTYRTRPAAREFFDVFVVQTVPTNATDWACLSDWAADSPWFMKGWERDPTIRGCLTMLDALDARFRRRPGLWPLLSSRDHPLITFQLLSLGDFGYSDDLYVKMNARGKALTPFEVLKAEIEQFAAEVFGDEGYSLDPLVRWRDHVSGQFDGAWTDFMWTHRDATSHIDSAYIRLIRAIAVVYRADLPTDKSSIKQYEAEIEALLNEPEPTLPFLHKQGCKTKDFVEALVRLFDTFAAPRMSGTLLARSDYLDEAALVRRIERSRGRNEEGGLTLTDWVTFYAWCGFVFRFSDRLGEPETQEWFHEWIRLTTNLARNSPIDRTDRAIRALRGVAELWPYCGANLLVHVAENCLEGIVGLGEKQREEERCKARLIVRSENWRPFIEAAEKHPYFQGDINFLLHFSGIFVRVNRDPACRWGEDEDQELRTRFADYFRLACAIFPEDGSERVFPSFLWERALLARGDYMLPNGSNWSFLRYEKDDRASWKRLLRADTNLDDRDERRDVVRKVFDLIDPDDVENSLRAIVASGVQDTEDSFSRSWRSCLVAEPRLIEFCKKRLLRIEGESVFLVESVRLTGWHTDLFLYAKYLRLQARQTGLAPFGFSDHRLTRSDREKTLFFELSTVSGSTIRIEKPDEKLLLQLRLGEHDTQAADAFSDWETEDERQFRRRCRFDDVEEIILGASRTLAELRPLPWA